MKDRWAFGKEMLMNPLELTLRLAFADWLAEHDMTKAEQRQREYVKILSNPLSVQKYLHAQTPFMCVQCVTKAGVIRNLNVKADGEINISPFVIIKQQSRLPVISFIKWQQHKKFGYGISSYDKRVGENMIWIKEQLLLDTCEAIGVKLA